MGNQGVGGGAGGRRNPFQPPMSEEEKKRARERRQEECKCLQHRLIITGYREEEIGGCSSENWKKEEEARN